MKTTLCLLISFFFGYTILHTTRTGKIVIVLFKTIQRFLFTFMKMFLRLVKGSLETTNLCMQFLCKQQTNMNKKIRKNMYQNKKENTNVVDFKNYKEKKCVK